MANRAHRVMKAYTQQQVAKAVSNSNGVMSTVAAHLGCSWRCARDYVEKWPEVKAAFDAEGAKLNNTAYQSFHRAIANGERWAVERILDTSARRDGHGMVSHASIDHTSAGERIEGIAVEFVTATPAKEPPPKPIAKAKPVAKPPAKPQPAKAPPPAAKPEPKPPANPPAAKPPAATPQSFRASKHKA